MGPVAGGGARDLTPPASAEWAHGLASQAAGMTRIRFVLVKPAPRLTPAGALPGGGAGTHLPQVQKHRPRSGSALAPHEAAQTDCVKRDRKQWCFPASDGTSARRTPTPIQTALPQPPSVTPASLWVHKHQPQAQQTPHHPPKQVPHHLDFMGSSSRNCRSSRPGG